MCVYVVFGLFVAIRDDRVTKRSVCSVFDLIKHAFEQRIEYVVWTGIA